MVPAKTIKERFADLASEVREGGGCRSVTMGDLRDMVGAGRLDSGPVIEIGFNLRHVGLRSGRLSTHQDDWVLVYDVASPVGRIVTAAQGGMADADEHLRDAAKELARSEAKLRSEERDELEQLRATVEQIRALVSPPAP